MQSLLAAFRKNRFPTIFGGHVELLCKTQSAFILETVRDRAISTKFWTHRVYAESTEAIFRKNRFPTIFGGLKCKNEFILETVQDRALLMKFLTRRVSAECTGDISQKSLCHHFWRPS